MRRLIRASVVGLVAVMVIVAGSARSDARTRSAAVTRQISGTLAWSMGSYPDANCFHQSGTTLSGTLVRPGLGTWTFSFQGCPSVVGVLRSVSGPLTVTTWRGVHLSGIGRFAVVNGTQGLFLLELTDSDGEYASGEISAGLFAWPASSAPAIGTVVVDKTAASTVHASAASSSVRSFRAAAASASLSASLTSPCPNGSLSGSIVRGGVPWTFSANGCATANFATHAIYFSGSGTLVNSATQESFAVHVTSGAGSLTGSPAGFTLTFDAPARGAISVTGTGTSGTSYTGVATGLLITGAPVSRVWSATADGSGVVNLTECGSLRFGEHFDIAIHRPRVADASVQLRLCFDASLTFTGSMGLRNATGSVMDGTATGRATLRGGGGPAIFDFDVTLTPTSGTGEYSTATGTLTLHATITGQPGGGHLLDDGVLTGTVTL